MIFRSGPGVVTCEQSGHVSSVAHRRRPEHSYLSGATLGALVVDGRPVVPSPPELLLDSDEAEFTHEVPGVLRVVVRHTFSAGWGLRLSFSGLAGRPQQVERAELLLRPDDACVAWALALGVTGGYTVAPADGSGAVLGAVLRLGSLSAVTGSGLELGGFELTPGVRYVVQLQWDWYATPRAFGRQRYPESPPAVFLTTGEPLELDVSEDVAVLAPDALATRRRAGQLELVSEERGVYPVELRSARGTTRFDLEWVPSVAELLAERAADALTGPLTAAGVVRLPGVADALVVQHALALSALDDPDRATEALDLYTDRLLAEPGGGRGAAGPRDPLQVAYLCREHDRSGDADLLSEAADAVLAHTGPAPGLGLAATQLCLGLMVSGRPVGPVLAHLLRLVAGLDLDPVARAAPFQPLTVSARAAALELVGVTSAGPGASGHPPSPVQLSPVVGGLGLHLGGGLRGRAVRPLPVAELAHLLAVFQLLPDGLSAQQQRVWGCSAHALARRSTPELVARLAGAPIGPADAWLALATQTG